LLFRSFLSRRCFESVSAYLPPRLVWPPSGHQNGSAQQLFQSTRQSPVLVSTPSSRERVFAFTAFPHFMLRGTRPGRTRGENIWRHCVRGPQTRHSYGAPVRLFSNRPRTERGSESCAAPSAALNEAHETIASRACRCTVAAIPFAPDNLLGSQIDLNHLRTRWIELPIGKVRAEHKQQVAMLHRMEPEVHPSNPVSPGGQLGPNETVYFLSVARI